MGLKKPPTDQPSFSRCFDNALIETRFTDAMVKSDGWSLEAYADAPPWLKHLYDRHALAVRKEMREIEADESTLKPSEHH